MQIDSQVAEAVRPELQGREQLLWTGRPNAKRTMLRSLPAAGFGAVWTAFIVNFMWTWYTFPKVDRSGPAGLFGLHGALMALFFVPFILIGVGLLLSPLWDYLGARSTYYIITNARILIVEGKRSRTFRSYYPADLGVLERSERADGSGDLTFAQKVSTDSEGHRKIEALNFVGIPEVRQVERLLRETLLKCQSAGPASP